VALRRDAYKADPNDVRARRALEAILLRRANLWYLLKKPDASIQQLLEAAQLWSLDKDAVDPERGEVEYDLFWIYAEESRAREAQLHRTAALTIFTSAARKDKLSPNHQRLLDSLLAGTTPQPRAR
jgi:hypothetical protein